MVAWPVKSVFVDTAYKTACDTWNNSKLLCAENDYTVHMSHYNTDLEDLFFCQWTLLCSTPGRAYSLLRMWV